MPTFAPRFCLGTDFSIVMKYEAKRIKHTVRKLGQDKIRLSRADVLADQAETAAGGPEELLRNLYAMHLKNYAYLQASELIPFFFAKMKTPMLNVEKFRRNSPTYSKLSLNDFVICFLNSDMRRNSVNGIDTNFIIEKEFIP